MTPRVVLGLRLMPETKRALELAARREGRSVSGLIRRLLTEYVERNQRKNDGFASRYDALVARLAVSARYRGFRPLSYDIHGYFDAHGTFRSFDDKAISDLIGLASRD